MRFWFLGGRGFCGIPARVQRFACLFLGCLQKYSIFVLYLGLSDGGTRSRDRLFCHLKKGAKHGLGANIFVSLIMTFFHYFSRGFDRIFCQCSWGSGTQSLGWDIFGVFSRNLLDVFLYFAAFFRRVSFPVSISGFSLASLRARQSGFYFLRKWAKM